MAAAAGKKEKGWLLIMEGMKRDGCSVEEEKGCLLLLLLGMAAILREGFCDFCYFLLLFLEDGLFKLVLIIFLLCSFTCICSIL